MDLIDFQNSEKKYCVIANDEFFEIICRLNSLHSLMEGYFSTGEIGDLFISPKWKSKKFLSILRGFETSIIRYIEDFPELLDKLQNLLISVDVFNNKHISEN
jgi:hypothetical protein